MICQDRQVHLTLTQQSQPPVRNTLSSNGWNLTANTFLPCPDSGVKKWSLLKWQFIFRCFSFVDYPSSQYFRWFETAFHFPLQLNFMYESNPRVPIPPQATPRHLTRIKSRVGRNLTFVQVPVPQAFDTMKKTSQHLVYPNNMHQYQSRQQCKGFFSILFCNHMSSVKYRKQEKILKTLDTMNQRSQFYNVLKYQ